MTNEIKNILSLYNTILENRNVLDLIEITTVPLNKTNYPNVKYDRDATQYDEVNKALLDDLQTAASKANIIVTVTTAKSGHSEKTVTGNQSRHGKQTAVDIATINNIGSGNATDGKNGNPEFRTLGNRLKDALVSMGYKLNVESGNDKAVLWQTNTGGNHFNHLHVSNNTESTGVPTNTLDSAGTPTSSGAAVKTTATADDYYYGNRELGQVLSSPIKGLQKESKTYGDFGKGSKKRFGNVILPKDGNEKIKSPIKGLVVRGKYNPSCSNQITIEHVSNGKKFYLLYCGITRPSVSVGSKVSVGTILGKTDNDVEISLYDTSFIRVYIDSYIDNEDDVEVGKNKKLSDKKDRRFDSKPEEYYPNVYGRVMGDLISSPLKMFKDKYDENGNKIEKRWGSPTEKEQPTDWLNQLSPTYKKKMNEEIEKIKKML